ncbi:MAG: 50S ribosomal protein L25 [Thermoflexales bacterium]|nr:50S ribosomal protein L25 [Thermoflexales bacterium]
MEQFELAVSPRTITGKQVKSLRRQGQTPAIIYGRHVEPMPLQMDTRTFKKVLAKAGASHLIRLTIEGRAEPELALVRQVHREPISGNFYHVDFLAVSMSERIRLSVPVIIDGESTPVTRGEGLLLQTMNEIEIECLPGDLIDAVHVDVSGLTAVGMEITVKDMIGSLGSGVQVLAELDEAVVRINAMRVEEEVVEAVPAEVVTEVEVITKGKVEEEEAAE